MPLCYAVGRAREIQVAGLSSRTQSDTQPVHQVRCSLVQGSLVPNCNSCREVGSSSNNIHSSILLEDQPVNIIIETVAVYEPYETHKYILSAKCRYL
jgi:hypothetical protein